MSKEEAAEELYILQTTLEELHPGLNLYRSTADINSKFDSLNSVIQGFDSLALQQCLYYYSEISGWIRCGHTVIYAPTGICDNYLPISVVGEDNKLFIARWHGSNTNVQPEYKEIIKIDGIPVSEIISIIRKRISADGYNETSKLYRIHSDFSILYRKYFDCKPQYNLELRSTGGDTLNQVVVAANREEIMKTSHGQSKAITEKIIKNDTCYLRLPTFYTKELRSNNINYRSTIRDFFREVKNKNGKEIIIDIRGNRGGSVHMAGYLASFIIDSTFTFFNSVELNNTGKITFDQYIQKDPFYRFRRTITKNMGAKRYYTLHRELRDRNPHPLRSRESNHITILIDHMTFSAATMFAALLKAKSDAIFIGEETGGTCIGSGLSPVKLTLPYSHFIAEIPVAYIHLSVTGLQDVQLYRGVQPDLPASPVPDY